MSFNAVSWFQFIWSNCIVSAMQLARQCGLGGLGGIASGANSVLQDHSVLLQLRLILFVPCTLNRLVSYSLSVCVSVSVCRMQAAGL